VFNQILNILDIYQFTISKNKITTTTTTTTTATTTATTTTTASTTIVVVVVVNIIIKNYTDISNLIKKLLNYKTSQIVSWLSAKFGNVICVQSETKYSRYLPVYDVNKHRYIEFK